MSEEKESVSVVEDDTLVTEKTEAEFVSTEEVYFLKREGLSSRAICAAYVRGSKCISKPHMVDKMLKPEGMHFNFFAWILGPYYYLYRKQWKIGWIWLAICAVMTIVTNVANNEMLDPIGLSIGTNAALTVIDYAWFFVGGIGGIVMGFLFYLLYRRSAERAYDEWKSEADPQEDLDVQDAEKNIESKGGTNLAAGLGSYIAAVILVFVLAFANPQPHGTGPGDYSGPAGSTTKQFMQAYDEEGREIYADSETGTRYVVTPMDIEDVSVSVERADR